MQYDAGITGGRFMLHAEKAKLHDPRMQMA